MWAVTHSVTLQSMLVAILQCALPEGIPRTLSRAAKPFILICSSASLSLHFMAWRFASCCSNPGQLQLILGLVLALMLLDLGAMGYCPEPFSSVCSLPLCALWGAHPMLLLTSLEFSRWLWMSPGFLCHSGVRRNVENFFFFFLNVISLKKNSSGNKTL